MKAMQVTRVDTTPALSLSTTAAPLVLDASFDSVLLRVLTCSLSPGDIKLMTGVLPLPRGKKSLPYTPGLEVCGVVEALGKKAAASGLLRVGDRVLAVQRPQRDLILRTAVANKISGGLAEYVVVEAALCVVVPSSISSLDAVTLPLAGVTAVKILQVTEMKSDSKVLVLNASSRVGAMVVELAKRVAGAAFVAGTTTNATLVKTLPLDQVLLEDGSNPTKWHDVLQGQQLDIVVDCGGASKETGWRLGDKVLARSRSSRYVYVLGDLAIEGAERSTKELVAMSWDSMAKTLWNVPQVLYVGQFPTKDTMAELLTLVDQKKLPVSAVTPLPFTVEALQAAVARAQDPRNAVSGQAVFQVSE